MNTLFDFDDEISSDKTSENAKTPALRVLEIHARLCDEYNCPIPYFHDLDPLSELVSALLSHRTKNADSSRAFHELMRRFPTWPQVRDAPTAEIEDAIKSCTWPEQKAPRLQEVLRQITLRRGGKLQNDAQNSEIAGENSEILGSDSDEISREIGDMKIVDSPREDAQNEELSLDFLAEMSVESARSWLEELVGVGPKSSAAVLAFSRLRRRALPVDPHHHRVAQRLGLIPKSLSVGPSHRVLETQLPVDWNAQQVYDNHEILMLHGQRVCFHFNPACAKCVLLDLCPTGQLRINQ